MRLSIVVKWSVVLALAAGLWWLATDKVIRWQEDVQLQSGEVIRVKRKAVAHPFGQLGGPGGWENKGMTMEIVSPNKASGYPSAWSAPFVPLVFDRDSDTSEWFIVATFYSCVSWDDLGRPKLPYTEFRYRNGAWVQQALSPKFIGRQGNMLSSIHYDGEPDHTIESKRLVDSDPSIDITFKQVVSSWKHNC